jgi:hypothetical protein
MALTDFSNVRFPPIPVATDFDPKRTMRIAGSYLGSRAILCESDGFT